MGLCRICRWCSVALTMVLTCQSGSIWMKGTCSAKAEWDKIYSPAEVCRVLEIKWKFNLDMIATMVMDWVIHLQRKLVPSVRNCLLSFSHVIHSFLVLLENFLFTSSEYSEHVREMLSKPLHDRDTVLILSLTSLSLAFNFKGSKVFDTKKYFAA